MPEGATKEFVQAYSTQSAVGIQAHEIVEASVRQEVDHKKHR